MKHSKNFNKVKEYYEKYLRGEPGGWNKNRVRQAVVKGWITEEEYFEIVGELYNE